MAIAAEKSGVESEHAMSVEDHITQLAVRRRFDFWRREGHVIVWMVGFWVSYHSDPLKRLFVLLLLYIIVSDVELSLTLLSLPYPAPSEQLVAI